jgi:hypothetical protein
MVAGCGGSSAPKAAASSSETTTSTSAATGTSASPRQLARADLLRGRLQSAGFTVKPAVYEAASEASGQFTPAYASLEGFRGGTQVFFVFVFDEAAIAKHFAAQLLAKDEAHLLGRVVGEDFYLQTAGGTVAQLERAIRFGEEGVEAEHTATTSTQSNASQPAIPDSAGSSGSAFAYPAAVQSNVIHSCEATGGSSSDCECVLRELERRLSVEQLAEAEAEAVETGSRSLLPVMERVAASCR